MLPGRSQYYYQLQMLQNLAFTILSAISNRAVEKQARLSFCYQKVIKIKIMFKHNTILFFCKLIEEKFDQQSLN